MTLEDVLATRPAPGAPRPYLFPEYGETVVSSGLRVLTVDLAGRPLVSASLVVRRGAFDEPAALGGATVLAARAMTEGTERYPGLELVEAAERLGATLHAEASWDAFGASVDVPASRLRPALELLAELVRRPLFPETEVARLRDERINDLLQIRADPRRRAEQAFAAAIYLPGYPYARPAAGAEETVRGLDRDALRRVHDAVLLPGEAALVVGGDLAGVDVAGLADELLGGLVDTDRDREPASIAGVSGVRPAGGGALATSAARASADASSADGASADGDAVERTFVRLVDRPGSVQSEIRIGHAGVARRTPDFHAVQVMSAILGGLFNSRLQMNLREQKGYTYGVGAGFEMRRAAGPFAVRTAVNTAATAPAVVEALQELRRMRDELVTEAELRAARDYLVGVFPLRFETPGAVVGAIGGLFVHDLPHDELARYRSLVEAVGAADVRAAAERHVHPDRAAIVVVGDAEAVVQDLEAAGLGPVEVIEDDEAAGAEAAAAAAAEAGDGSEVAG